MADRGLKPSQWTSARLKKEVLYLETHSRRFELVCETANDEGVGEDKFKFSACKTPLALNAMLEVGVPLPAKHTSAVQKGLMWEDIKWSAQGLYVGQELYPVVRIQWLPISAKTTGGGKKKE